MAAVATVARAARAAVLRERADAAAGVDKEAREITEASLMTLTRVGKVVKGGMAAAARRVAEAAKVGGQATAAAAVIAL